MTNLIPEQRPDKNGKLVTRHVKTGGGSKPATSLPAPAPVAPAKREPLAVIEDALAQKLEDGDDLQGIVMYLKMSAPITQQIVADALENYETDEEFDVLYRVINSAIDPGFLQLATSDIKFIVDLSKTVKTGDTSYPARRAVSVMESTFTNKFRSRGTRDSQEYGYTKHLGMFKAAVIARALEIDDNVSSDFEEYEQYLHIHENMELLMRHLPACNKVMVGMESHVKGKRATSEEAVAVCRILEEFPDSETLIVDFVEDRKSFDEQAVRESLTSASALSRGAL